MQGLVSFVLMAAAVSGSVINPNQDCLSVCPSGYAVSYTEGIDATKGKTTCFCDDQANLVQTCLKDNAFSVDNIKKCAESTGAKSSSVDGPAPQPDKQTQTTTTTKPNEVINPNQGCLSVCPSGYAVSYTEGIDATKGKTTCFCDDQAKLVQTCLKDVAFSVESIKKCAASTGAKSATIDGPAPQPDKQTTTTTKPNEVINPNQGCLSVCPSGYAVSYTEGDATKGKTTCFCDDQAKLVQSCMKDSPLTVDLIKKCATSTGAKSATVDGSNTTKPKPDGNGKGTESSPAPTNSGYQVGNSAESMSVGLSYMMALILLN